MKNGPAVGMLLVNGLLSSRGLAAETLSHETNTLAQFVGSSTQVLALFGGIAALLVAAATVRKTQAETVKLGVDIAEKLEGKPCLLRARDRWMRLAAAGSSWHHKVTHPLVIIALVIGLPLGTNLGIGRPPSRADERGQPGPRSSSSPPSDDLSHPATPENRDAGAVAPTDRAPSNRAIDDDRNGGASRAVPNRGQAAPARPCEIGSAAFESISC